MVINGYILVKHTYDIVVPVVDGGSDFCECYSSLKEYTPLEQRILIVTVGAIGEGLLSYLKKIERDDDTVVLVTPEDHGFVSAVNRGISYSLNEVVLLASHTIVTPGWLNKLDDALFSSPFVGTATPWTNNGVVSFSDQYSDCISGLSQITFEELSEIVEGVCPGMYPELPTAFGYCMAIKRELVNAIGIFEIDTFGEGSYPAHDFGMRAREYGYVNVLDDCSYVQYKSEEDVAEAVHAHAKSHLKALTDRHPLYNFHIERFLKDDPLFHLKSRINRVVEDRQGSIHVLFMLHNDPIEGSSFAPAGSEKHVLSIADYLAQNSSIVPFILASNGKELSFFEKNRNGEWQRTRYLMPEQIWLTTCYSDSYKRRLHEVLKIYHIEIVHYHHLFNHPLDMTATLEDWDGGVCLSLHDHYALSPCFHLLGTDGKYCGPEDISECQTCLKGKVGMLIDIKWWRRMQKLNFERADLIFAPSSRIAETVEKTLAPSLKRPICVREHGVDLKFLAVKEKKGFHSPLRIGFLGELSPLKGSKLIKEIILAAKEDEFEWFLVGEVNDTDLNGLKNDNVNKTGRYEHKDLPDLLNSLDLDLIVLCSVCAETFSYTLSESWGSKIPVVVGPLGAPADRVRANGGGWIVEDLLPELFVAKLREIFLSPADYERKLRQVQGLIILTLAETANQYLEDYRLICNPEMTVAKNLSEITFWPGALFDDSDALVTTSKNSEEQRGKIFHLEANAQQDHKQIADLYTSLQNAQNDIQILSQEIQQLKATRHNLSAQLQNAQLYIKKLQDQNEYLQNTLSWRITEPLRQTSFYLRKLMGVLKK